METCSEVSTHHQPQLHSARQGRMKINSLLNPLIDTGPDEHCTASSPNSQHMIISSSPHSGGYTHSPISSPSLVHHWYGQYRGHHDTSSGAAPTAATRISNRSRRSNHHQHNQHQSQIQHPGSGKRHHNRMFLSYQPTNRSVHSSPDPYHSRKQHDTVSSRSSDNGDRRRAPRPKYKEEEMYFIWYHRVDLCLGWKEVRESFNRRFPTRQRRGFQGIQCKFYRFIKEKKCPTPREQCRMRNDEFLEEGAPIGAESGASRFGVRGWTNVWYQWMR
ncbi:uncharacterized protein N7446_010489 [Penicillium canescens]|uniref:Uncharacterized protein n=1 Tax=Penicillium canescens TaxID=5083 RepID=A0AAD6ICL6_PENCN|nr:uncharacterized protein N7446_010489 [Penicillium canescens]KAJ6041631.1 hypothetical protein N7460_007021 [Penicillium canescens]KAJ6050380.1 hypothetical protein N7446_010489 [Penicillium canescens]KAJ6064682.1 hypothetical protein N7444_000335 [Penicillium canescens]